MIDEYALVPDIFDPAAYSNPAFIDMCLPHLKEPLLQDAIVRDLRDGAWSRYCLENAGRLHRLTKEIVKKLVRDNRLYRSPAQLVNTPEKAVDWCNEALQSYVSAPLTGIVCAHETKRSFAQNEVASIEKLTGTSWWQKRSPSVTVDRKTDKYLSALGRVLQQANSLMFVDPYLDPTKSNYGEFGQLLAPLIHRQPRPTIEIHRSLYKGIGSDCPAPTKARWKSHFADMSTALRNDELMAEVFVWRDFHDRYLITDIVGITIPAGFDVTAKQEDWSTWCRMGRDDRDKIQRLFDPDVHPESLKWRFRIGSV